MKTILFFFSLFIGLGSFGQSLKGQILESNGMEIPFAKVRIQNTSYGTVANVEGRYVLELKKGTYVLQFDAGGFKTHYDTIEI